jgi:hypothetical protein
MLNNTKNAAIAVPTPTATASIKATPQHRRQLNIQYEHKQQQKLKIHMSNSSRVNKNIHTSTPEGRQVPVEIEEIFYVTNSTVLPSAEMSTAHYGSDLLIIFAEIG